MESDGDDVTLPAVADEHDRPDASPDATEGLTPSPGVASRGSRAARRRTRRRRVVVIGTLAIAVVLGAGAAAALVLSGGSTHPARRTASHSPTSVTSAAPATTAPTGPTTTTVIPRSSNPVVALAQQYDGLYVGTYTNTTFHTTGNATLDLRIDPSAGTLHVSLALTGDLFGAGGKQVRSIDGTIPLGSTPNATVTMRTDSFGDVTGQISGLSIVLTAPNVPDPKVQSFQLKGSLRGDLKGFDATFTVGFRNGSTAQGTATVLCSVSGQRPSQVPTLCASA